MLQNELHRSNIKDICRLSPLQEGIYFHTLTDEASDAYCSQLSYRLTEDMQPALIEKSIGLLLQRHDILRTVFRHQKTEEVVQIVLLERQPQLHFEDISHCAGQKEWLEDYRRLDRARKYDLGKDLLVRMAIFKTGDRQFELVWSYHHIIMDGWCAAMLLREFNEIYSSVLQGRASKLAKAAPYSAFIKWLGAQDREKAAAHWQQRLEGYEQQASLPRSYAKPIGEYHNTEVVLELGLPLSEQLTVAAANARITLNHLFQGIWGILLSRYTGLSDLVFGTVTALRPAAIPGINTMAGLLINTVPVRLRIDEEKTIGDFLTGFRDDRLQDEEFQYFPLADMQAASPLKHRLLDHLFITENYSTEGQFDYLDKEKDEQMLSGSVTGGFSQTNYDLNIILLPGRNICMRFNFNGAVFEEPYMRGVAQQVNYLAQQIAKGFDQPLSSLRLLTPGEEQDIVWAGEGKKMNYTGTVPALFSAQVKRLPNKLALLSSEGQWTYEELDRYARSLAAQLVQSGLKQGDAVGVMTGRSFHMVASLLAVTMAGGIYLPLEPNLPVQRLEHLLGGCSMTITTHVFSGRLDFFKGIKILADEIDTVEIREAFAGVDPGQTAYIIYTSGTTGMPKAVPVRHESIVSRVLDHNEHLGMHQEDIMLQFASVNFDASVIEMLMPLLSGGQLTILPEPLKQNAALMTAWIEEQGVTTAIFPPAYIKILDHHPLPTIRRMISTGEAAIRQDLQWYAVSKDVYNGYGPTEVCIGASFYRVQPSVGDENYSVPIGRPFADTGICILDRRQRLLPFGVPGEICISGIGLSEGYIGDETRTAEKFFISKFNNERYYRTGDLGRWNRQGELEYLGRIDDQVQLNGIRVETAEIVYALCGHPQIKDAIVRVLESVSAPVLVAYVCSPDALDTLELKAFLRQRLPAYMIPAQFFVLPSFPLTANGKTDIAKLPLPQQQEEKDRIPASASEAVLVATVAEVLNTSVHGGSDFFWSGGDSIKAIQLVSRLHRKGYKLDVKTIFEQPILRELALQLQSATQTAPQEPVTGPVLLTPIQHEFFSLPLAAPHHFNQSLLFRPVDRFNTDALYQAICFLAVHHDVLRMTFNVSEGRWMGMGHPASYEPHFEIVDLRSDPSPSEALTAHAQELQSGTSLHDGPLFRTCVYQLPDGDRLLVIVHHLLVDGVSWRILLEDLAELYRQSAAGEPLHLPLKTTSMRDWAAALGRYSNSEDFLRQQAYWLQGPTQADELPLENTGEEGSGQQVVVLDEEGTNALLRRVHHAYGTEINDILLSALSLSLYRTCGMERSAILLEGHGREELIPGMDLSRTIGWFTSLYPIVLEANEERTLGLHIKNTKELLRAVPNKGIGYGLWKYLHRKEEEAPKEPVAVLFNYLGQFDEDAGSGPLTLATENAGASEDPGSKSLHPLAFSVMVINHSLRVTVRYDRSSVSAAMAGRLAKSFLRALREVIDHCRTRFQKELTPSDLDIKGMSIEQLDALEATYRARFGCGLQSAYPLTPMQEGMLFHTLADEDSRSYIYQVRYRVQGQVSMPLVRQTVQTLIDRHEVLRTVIEHKGYDSLFQSVLLSRDAVVDEYDLRDLSDSDTEAWLQHFAAQDMKRGFDLAKDSLLRLSVCRHGADDYSFFWSSHHIILDGWCMGILLQEFRQLYASASRGEDLQLPAPVPYRHYLKWIGATDEKGSLNYWSQYLDGYSNSASIPAQPGEAAGQQAGKQKQVLQFSEEETQRLQEIALSSKVTISNLLQTAWGVLLARYNDTADVVFGCVVSGRPATLPGVDSMIGLFINTIPVRVRPVSGTSLVTLAQGVQKSALEAEAHHYCSLARIQAQTTSKAGLINCVLDFNNYPINSADASSSGSGWKIGVVQSREETNYDLFISITSGVQLQLNFYFNAEVYALSTIERLAAHFKNILTQILADKWVPAEKLQLASVSGQQALLQLGAGPKRTYPSAQGFAALFHRQAPQWSSHPAISDHAHQWTYAEVDEWSHTLAFQLREEQGLVRGDIVAAAMDRGVYLIASIIAIWKAGGVYMPVSSELPSERRTRMLAESGAKIILHTGSVGDDKISCLDVTQIQKIQVRLPQEWIATGDDAAYLLYTSGSTGTPKGAVVQQDGMVNHLCSRIERYGLDASSRIAQTAAMSFDISIWQMMAALLCGGQVRVYAKDEQVEVRTFLRQVNEDGITVLQFVPAYASQLLDITARENRACPLPSLKIMIMVGEELKPALVAATQEMYPDVRLINTYGPTEAADTITDYEVDPLNTRLRIPVGRPIANMRIHVLNTLGQLCPEGVPGQIWVSGVGVGRGYWQQEERTATVFRPDPFIPGNRMYNTGDTGCWSADGLLFYHGRRDHQVKINGHRVELAEIEHHLLAYPGLNQATVIFYPRTEAGEWSGLAAYVNKTGADEEALRHWLSGRLPSYMVPASIMPLETFPLNANGKTDRAKLPRPGYVEIRVDENETLSEKGELLRAIWAQVLAAHVGPDDHFMSLGGDSIKAIQVASRCYTAGYQLSIKDIFQYPTVRQLAAQLQPLQATSDQSAVTGQVPLTPIQYRFFSTHMKKPNRYNQAFVFELPQRVLPETVAGAFNLIVLHHDALRARFSNNGGVMEQWIDAPYTIEPSFFNWRQHEEYGPMMHTEVERMQSSFVLSKGRLVHVALFSLPHADVLLVIAHHLVIDGVSWRILMEDLELLMQQAAGGQEMKLPPKTDSFQVWANSLLDYSRREGFGDERAYWQEVAQKPVSSLALLHTPVEANQFATTHFVLDIHATDRLQKELPAHSGVRVMDVLLASLAQALKKTLGLSEIIIDLEGHGREDVFEGKNFTRTVGWFTSLYPLHISIGSDPWQQVLALKKSLDEVPNKGVGYGIWKYLEQGGRTGQKRATGQLPIIFNYLGQFGQEGSGQFSLSGGHTGKSMDDDEVKEHLLNVSGFIAGGQLRINIEYCSLVFDHKHIEGLAAQYHASIMEIIQEGLQSAAGKDSEDYSYKELSSEELHHLHHLFN